MRKQTRYACPFEIEYSKLLILRFTKSKFTNTFLQNKTKQNWKFDAIRRKDLIISYKLGF